MLALADELEITLEKDVDQHQLLKSITHAPARHWRAQGKRVLLCLDEAQAIPVESLEALRLLTNLETEKRKLLQIVLFGQPELNRKLELDSIRQLAQRITFHYHLGPLEPRRPRVLPGAPAARSPASPARACSAAAPSRKLFSASGGIPRLVNILAHKALMLAYGAGQAAGQRAPRRRRGAAIPCRPRRRAWPWLAGASTLAAAAGVTWALIR